MAYHMPQYRYVGERGEEYRVIQGVFAEINRLPELTNRQIRWYAVILHLVGSFSDWQLQAGLADGLFPGNGPVSITWKPSGTASSPDPPP